MPEDVKIITDKINYKYRVNGIIIKEDKVLTVEIDNNGFYCLPGGHIELGEDSKAAALREMKEEFGIDNKIVNLVSIAENFFEMENGKKVHELGFYYLLEPIDNIETNDYEIIEKDKNRDVPLKFKWIPLEDIDNYNFKPVILKEKLKSKDFSFEHIIIKNNIRKK